MKSFLVFLFCLGLALGSFAFARCHYVEIHTGPGVSSRTSRNARYVEPFMHADLMSGWMKDEWVFALAVPAVLIFGGMALSTRQ